MPPWVTRSNTQNMISTFTQSTILCCAKSINKLGICRTVSQGFKRHGTEAETVLAVVEEAWYRGWNRTRVEECSVVPFLGQVHVWHKQVRDTALIQNMSISSLLRIMYWCKRYNGPWSGVKAQIESPVGPPIANQVKNCNSTLYFCRYPLS